MSYFAQTSDLQNRYGANNISLMADLEGNGPTTDAAAIAARITLALTIADQWVWACSHGLSIGAGIGRRDDRRQRRRRAPAPYELRVMYAGWYLLTARGTGDFDKDGKPMNHLYADYRMQQARKAIAKKLPLT